MSTSNDVAEEYASSLSDLVANSKPLINMLTMLAEENIDHAPAIVQAVERHLQQVPSDIKLPVLYLIDSIVKNVRQAYTGLFTQNIVSTFCSVFEKVDEKTRGQMYKLRQTWNDVFPPKKLYAMDVRVNSIDPAWPITAPVPTSIHINPKFFAKPGATQTPTIVSPLPTLQSGPSTLVPVAASSSIAVPEDPQAIAEAKMREQLLKKKKKLLELQQKKLELELLQTKAKLEEQQKQLDRQTDHFHVQQLLLPALQNVSPETATKIFGTSLLDVSGSLALKSDSVVPSNMLSAQMAGTPHSTSSGVPASSAPSRAAAKTKTEGTVLKPKASGKPNAGAESINSRSRDPRLATRQPAPAQPSVVASENMQPSSPQLEPSQENTSSVFETVKLETAKPKPQITINIANKGNSNKEPQGVSKKDPRLNSNKVHVSNSKNRSNDTKGGGPSKGPNKSTRGPSPLPAPQSPSRSSKTAPLPRKVHGKGSSVTTSKTNKSASVIDLTDSPPHKQTDKKEEELTEKDKDSQSESPFKLSSSASSSGSNSSSSPGSKKDIHKSKMNSTGKRQSPSEKKKGSKVVELGPGGNSRRAKSPGGRRSRERERDRSVNKKFDMFEPEADSPSPPPPPVISDNKKREDTTFKDVKVSKKGRNYVRRNRRDESRSPEVSGMSSGDVDLRLGAPPEKHPRMGGGFPADATASEDDTKKTLIDATTKDVDLRQLSRSPSKKRPSVERSDQPPNKKSKAEMIDVLFGNEDVDLRQLAPITVVTQASMPPSPPPPPIISQPSPTPPVTTKDNSSTNTTKVKNETDKEMPSEKKSDNPKEDNLRSKENGDGKNFRGWEKYKESKPDIYKSPFRSHKFEPTHKVNSSPLRETVYGSSRERAMSHFNRQVGEKMEYDGLGRPLLYHRVNENVPMDRRHRPGQNAMSSPLGEDTDMRTHLVDPDTLDDVDLNINIIIQQAEEQLKNGTMSFSQYNTLLKQVIHLNEMQKLREAKRRDFQENKEWERNRRRGNEMGKSSPCSEDENSRDSLPGGRYGDIDERFPVLKARAQQPGPGPGPSPPEPQWNEMGPHHGRPGMWEQHPPPPWARGMGPGGMGPMPGPGPQFPPRMMHGGPPFHRPPGPGQDFPPGPNNFGALNRWRPQFNRPPFEGEMDGRPVSRYEQFNMRFPRPGGPGPGPGVPGGPGGPGVPGGPPPPIPPPAQQQPPPPSQAQPPLQQPTPQQLANGELPLADAMLLDAIAQDSMRTINIDGVPREIRFYGDTAVVMLSWDDPREIGFQGGTRCISFDDRETILCSFNEPYREFVLDGCKHSIRLGAPTRELYVDGKWYECFFGGPPVSIEMGGKSRLVKLEGPPPQVKIGMLKRTDLVAGKINLIINARNMVPIFLDAKPQRFDIEGKPHILRFTHALTNVQINGRSFKVEFGGLPKPIVVRGKKHFIRFSVLPRGIQPGYISIVNMEGGRLPSPARTEGENDSLGFSPSDESDEAKLRKVNEPALPMLGTLPRKFAAGQESPSDSKQARNSPAVVHSDAAKKVVSQLPLEMLTSLMPVAMAPSSGYSYQVEQDSQEGQTRQSETSSAPPSGGSVSVESGDLASGANATTAATVASPSATPAASSLTAVGIPFLLPEINVDELFQKLVATGIVTTPSSVTEEGKKKKDDDMDSVKFVDFSQPETLKVRQPALITALYSGIQCSSCGVRFAPEQTMKYSQHLDWHFRQNRRDRDNTRKAQSRKWYYDISDWIQFEEIEDLEERAQSWFETQQAAEGRAEEKEPVEVPSVPAGDNAEDTACDVCHDKFEQFYNEETEEWHLRLAIRVDGKTYHPLCYEDLKANLERSLDDSNANDEMLTKPDENEKDVDKNTDEKDPEEVNEKKTEEEEVKAEGTDVSPPGDSAVQETEEKNTGEETEVTLKVEETEEVKVKEEHVANESTEQMQVADCSTVSDSTVVKAESEAEAPMEEDVVVPVVPKVDTTHTEVACSIDGNVKFEDKPQSGISGPISGKIKINIMKQLPAPVREPQGIGDAEGSTAEGDPDDSEETQATPVIEGLTSEVNELTLEPTLEQEFPEPPPPGIEPVRLKPRLVGRKLTEMPPVMKGTELSGLCSIM